MPDVTAKEDLKGTLRMVGKAYCQSEISQGKKVFFYSLGLSILILNCPRYSNNMVLMFFTEPGLVQRVVNCVS
jgi:hypothetical protein